MRTYNPLRFLAPIVVKYDILMQVLCEAKIVRDKTIPGPPISQWSNLVAVLAEAQSISIGEPINFVAIVYLWIEIEDGHPQEVAKIRIVPMKKQSIPSFELSAVRIQ